MYFLFRLGNSESKERDRLSFPVHLNPIGWRLKTFPCDTLLSVHFITSQWRTWNLSVSVEA